MRRGWGRWVRDWLLVVMGGVALVLLGLATRWVHVGATNSTIITQKLPEYERRLNELEELTKEPDGLLFKLNRNLEVFNHHAENFNERILGNPVMKLLIGNPVEEDATRVKGAVRDGRKLRKP